MKPLQIPVSCALALLASLFLPTLATSSEVAATKPEKLYSGKPLQGLLITGGCCHNYAFQAEALTKAVEAKADITWKVVNQGGTGTRGEIELYNDPNWAKPYDVIVHNECFADTDSLAYVQKITAGHQAGKPAVVIHCAMHTYRAAKFDDWRELLGVSSFHHEHQSKYPVKVVAAEHPIMKGFPADWVTPMDELYILKKVWPTTKALATSKSEKSGEEQAVFWTSDYHGARVFGTTYGHSDDTFRDPVYLNTITRGILWAAGKLGE